MKTTLALSLVLLTFACGDDDGVADANSPLSDVQSVGDSEVRMDAGNDTGTPDVGVDAMVVMDSGPDSGPDAGPPADTYENFAMAFMTTYCVECHGAGSARRDYSTIDDIRRDMVNVRCGVTAEALDDCGAFPPPRQFPVGSGATPSDEERDRLVAWVEGGLI